MGHLESFDGFRCSQEADQSVEIDGEVPRHFSNIVNPMLRAWAPAKGKLVQLPFGNSKLRPSILPECLAPSLDQVGD
jgi:hypothetical protein